MNKPNVVFILTDDQGPWAMGCAGNDEIITPNLDRLSAEGTRYENFFCASPVCSPARASLLTGKIPSQHGVHDWIREGHAGADGIEYLQDHIGYTEVLAENGYTCGLSGKWHLGSCDIPQKGFEHWYAHLKGSDHYYKAPMFRDGNLVYETEYVSDLITDDAVHFITDHASSGNPFYCSVHYTAPHSPWGPDEHPQEIRDLYKDCPFESCPQEPYHPDARSRFSPEDARECLIGYFSAVTGMDRGVGRILNTLDVLGIRNDTFVFFVSDNGFNCGHHGIWGKGNGTLALNMYDTSVKVPAIASMPGTVPENRVSDAMVSGYDFMPTLLDLLGFEVPESDNLPGTSFCGDLLGTSEGERDNVVIFDEYGPTRMVRTKEWKYVHRYPYGPHELYNLGEDPGERQNRYGGSGTAEIVESLKSSLDTWFLRYVDPSVDGAREPVAGAGQMCLAGLGSKGQLAFNQHRPVSTNPSDDPGMKKEQ